MSLTAHILQPWHRVLRDWARRNGNGRPVGPHDPLQLALAMEHELWVELLPVWFARCVDADGGFYPKFGPGWKRRPEARRGVVYQARITWMAAEAAQACTDNAQSATYVTHARHGAEYLLRAYHDAPYGGFFWVIDADAGTATEALGLDKHLYGQAFVVYALANAFGAAGEQHYLDAAVELFHWIDTHAHDPEGGGYNEQLRRDGRQRAAGDRVEDRSVFAPSTPMGYRTANTHLHVLEAWLVLHAHCRDERIRARLEELVELMCQRMIVPPGCMHAMFTADWRPVPMHDSFGHDVEAAVLLLDAATSLGRAEDAAMHEPARSLVDHALAVGFDHQHGGLADTGEAFGAPCRPLRYWWVQAELLQALALMHALHGGEDGRYLSALARQWRFIQGSVIDRSCGGWQEVVNRRGRALPDQPKAHAWKAAYHETRALLNASRWLREAAAMRMNRLPKEEGSKL